MNVCAVEECLSAVKSRGWCTKHYTRWRRYGDVNFTHKSQPSKGNRLCSVEECNRAHDSHGYCSMHAQRVKSHGGLETVTRPPGDSNDEQRLKYYGWTETHGPLDTPCWEFNGPRMKEPFDYGRIARVGGKLTLTHRLAYEIWVGPIPEGAGYHGTVVRHKCDNPPCINPNHLETGTQAQNARDASSRGRSRGGGLRGEQAPWSKLTREQVREIRASDEFQKVLAVRYNTTQANISLIKRGINWKDA